MGRILGFLICAWMAAYSQFALAADSPVPDEYRLGAGDTVRIQVFQNPDLTLETRVSEGGVITYPLIGSVQVGGLTISAAEKKIAKGLRDGGFVQQPQVNISVLQVRGSQVSVLGLVSRAGRFPLETFNTRVTEVLAMAGGIAPNGADTVILVGIRNGKPFRKEIDVASLYLNNQPSEDIVVAGGDSIYVHRAPVFYVYGEVQRPGSFRVERAMTVQQALAQGGGLTQRGTESRMRLHRRSADGKVQEIKPSPHTLIMPDDVLYVGESLF